MHIYYYEKNGYYYVLDKNHKLYRYPKKNNIENILILENCLIKFQNLIEEQEIFHFKTIKEWNAEDWFNITNCIQNITLLEYHYFKNNAFLIFLIESILGNLAYQTYKNFKEKRIQNNDFYELLLKKGKKDVKEYKSFLTKIASVTKEEVSFAELDPNIPKKYLNCEDIFKNYFDTVHTELEANIHPIKFFSEPNLNNPLLSKERYLEKEEMWKNANQIKLKMPLEVNQKIYYAMLASFKNCSFFIANVCLSIPFIGKLLENYKIGNIATSGPKNGFFLLTSLSLFLLYIKYNKNLNQVENPILTLKKSK